MLGIDGYAPSAVQYEADAEASSLTEPASGSAPAASLPRPVPAPASAPTSAPQAKVAKTSATAATEQLAPPAERIDAAIETLLKYRTAGAGGAALKLLLTFVKNVADNPTEPK